jgi:hypothetical protein
MFKKTFSVSGLTLAALLLLCSFVPAMAQSWNSLTQTQRNDEIVNAGTPDIGKYGGECKTWVQNLVYATSKYQVWLPSTEPNNYMWQYSNNVVGVNMPIQYVQVGWILQLKLKSTGGPHTAIVFAVQSGGVWLLDSNWDLDGIVRLHYMTFATFNNTFSAFSAYFVL